MNQLAAYLDAKQLTGEPDEIATALDTDGKEKAKRAESSIFEKPPTEAEIESALNQVARTRWLAGLRNDVLSRMNDDEFATIDDIKAAIAKYEGRA